MRLFKLSLLAGVLSASASTAATVVSEYEAFASISVSLLSATYESTGADARASVSNGTWQDGVEFHAFASGTGQLERRGNGTLWAQDTNTYSRFNAVRGYADAVDTRGYSIAQGWITPTFNYSHECTRFSLDDCAGTDRIMLELTYDVVTNAWAQGGASATAEAFLGMEYFRDEYEAPWRPQGGWDFEVAASGVSSLSGTVTMALEAGSALGLDLYTRNVSGSATYDPQLLAAVPVPPAVPLMVSGLFLLGLTARRRAARAS